MKALPTDKQMADILTKPLSEAVSLPAPQINHGVVEHMRRTEGSVQISAKMKIMEAVACTTSLT